LREFVVISVDDRKVLAKPVKSYATTPATITVGHNLIGGSTAAAQFGGEIFSLTAAPMDAMLRLQSEQRETH
jgi:hypothetical protein